jgi:branched-chain amino acid aminotransferase
MIVFLDGRFVPEAEAVVSVFDRCFLYGDGLFEAIRLYGGKLFRWEQHFERLNAGAEALHIQVPETAQTIRKAATELWRQNNHPADAVIRLTLSRGAGPRGYSPTGANAPRLIMALHPLPAIEPRKSYKLITSSLVVAAGDSLAKYKTCNKLHQVLARAEADQSGANEALMINTDGHVAEATSSNLFWVANGVICTPPLESGALSGITRAVVLELASKLRISTREMKIAPKELCDSEGIFLSVSTLELVEVSHLDSRSIPHSEIVHQLQSAYRILVREELALGCSSN